MNESLNIGTSFIAGLLSFLSPCVLPLVPGYLTYLAGISFEELETGNDRDRLLKGVTTNALFFIFGFSVVFILMGASATLIGNALRQYATIILRLGGIVVIIMGLHLTNLLPISWFYREKRFHIANKPAGYLGSFFIGVTFAAGWTPCIGPILGSILLLASTQETLMQGISLLSFYSLGLGIPFFLAALATGLFLGFYKRIRRYITIFERLSGVLLIILGLLMVFNKFGWFAQWFSFFPELSQ